MTSLGNSMQSYRHLSDPSGNLAIIMEFNGTIVEMHELLMKINYIREKLYEILKEVHYGDSFRSFYGDAVHFPVGMPLTSSRNSYGDAAHVPEEFLWGCHSSSFRRSYWEALGCHSFRQGIPMGSYWYATLSPKGFMN